jgi:hypothetical protein
MPMMMDDKKKIASIIVAKAKPNGMDEVVDEIMPGEPMNDKSMALEDAASMIMSAIEKKDAKAMVSALKDFIDMCDEMEDMSEMESE